MDDERRPARIPQPLPAPVADRPPRRPEPEREGTGEPDDEVVPEGRFEPL